MHTQPDLTEAGILQLLQRVIDPEIGLNIIDLGLVYQVAFAEDKKVRVSMTLTTPSCPMGQTIHHSVCNLLEEHYPGFSIEVDLVWFPRWDPEMISEAGQARLNGSYQLPGHSHGHESLWGRYL